MLVRFGPFSLDEERRQVLEGETPVALEPKAYELLSLLVRRRPKALSKAQIRDALWPATAVSDSVVAGAVADVRAALDDDARRPLYIRTLHGFGYAFCAKVEGEPLPAPPAPSSGATLIWAGREIPLPEGEHLVGRDDSCLVQSRSARVSRRHARITVRGDRVLIEDLGSRNGTSVEGQRISGPVELRSGDTVVVGPETLVFLGSGQAHTTVSDTP